MTDIDLEDVADWALRQTWLPIPYTEEDKRWQRRDFPEPLIRLYRQARPQELEREQREAEERAREERMWEESRRAAEIAAEHTRRMRDMREWGRANGFFVGTRGRIPKKVINAYNEAKGIK